MPDKVATKKKVFEQNLKHEGYWSYKELYDFSYLYLKEEDFVLFEKKYEEKVNERGKDLKVDWYVYRKVTDYFKYTFDIQWRVRGLVDAEAEVGGKKTKTNKGEIKVKVIGILERDYEEKWEKKPLWKFLRGIYDKYIMRTTIDEHEEKLVNEATDFFNELKSFLNLESQQSS